MHDPGTERIADGRDLGIAREQAVHERARRMTRTRVHDETGRLGDDDDVGVFVPHLDVDVRLGLRRRDRRRLGEHVDDLTGAQLATLADGPPVDDDRARFQQRLHIAAAPAGQQRDRPVDAFTVE